MDEDRRRKDKGKKVVEDEHQPKNVKGTASSSHHIEVAEPERQITIDDFEPEEEEYNWRGPSLDWRDVEGVIGPTLNQGDLASCWACSVVRAVQALYNIGVIIQRRVELSVPHLVNNVNFNKKHGIGNMKKALAYVVTDGICSSNHGKQGHRVQKKSQNKQKLHCYKIDDYVVLEQINDVELLELVRIQPVVVVMPHTATLERYGENPSRRIYEDGSNSERSHVVLVVGFGRDDNGRPYWIIQNSWGKEWGFDGGFAYVYRQTKKDRPSIFRKGYYPTMRRKDGG